MVSGVQHMSACARQCEILEVSCRWRAARQCEILEVSGQWRAAYICVILGLRLVSGVQEISVCVCD